MFYGRALRSMLAAARRMLRPAPSPPSPAADLQRHLDRRAADQEAYGQRVLEVAARHLEVREAGRNRGAEVDAIISAAGGQLGDNWCALFAAHCHRTAADELGGRTSLPHRWARGALKLFVESLGRPDVRCVQVGEVTAGQVELEAGDIAILIRGAADEYNARRLAERAWDTALEAEQRWTSGHAALVERRLGTLVTTIEANIDRGDGDGVYVSQLSLADPRLVGFIRPRFSRQE